MQKTLRKLLSLSLFLALCLSLFSFSVPAKAENSAPSLDKTEIAMLLGGGLEHLTVLNAPEGAAITWTSDDWRVARVSNGNVISVGEGTANITATVSGMELKSKVNVYDGDNLITNDAFQLDTDGNPIFAQSGSIYKFGDTYYWYGVNFSSSASYYNSLKQGNGTTGSSVWSTIRCYSSTNLVDWKFEGDIASNGKNGWPGGGTWVARLGVVYNVKNDNYVLLSQQGSGAGKGSAVLFATSPSPTGPWTYKGYQKNLNTLGPDPSFSAGTGDMTVFYDYTTGKAYLIFNNDGVTDGIHTSQNTENTYPERDEQYVGVLNDDFTAIVEVHKMYDGKLLNLGREGGREANSMFTYGGWYYYASSALRGWNTSPTHYMAGKSPLGPFVDENGQANKTTEMKGSIGNFSHVSQVVGFTTMDTPVTPQAPLGQMVLEYGDRWSNIAGNGRGYDAFAPLSFEKGNNEWPVPVYNNMSQFYFDVAKGTWKPGPNNNYLDNPAFETDRIAGAQGIIQGYLNKPTGWNIENIAGQIAQINYGGNRATSSIEKNYQLLKNGQAYNSAFDGNYAWYHGYTKRNLGTDSYKTKTSQTVKNLPDGVYTLYAWVRSSGGQNESYLYAGSSGTEYKVPVNTAINDWTLFVADHIVVTGGTVEVGMYSDAAANQWAEFDDMALIRSGDLPSEPLVPGAFISGPEVITSGQSFQVSVGLKNVSSEVVAEDITIEVDTTKLDINPTPPVSLDTDAFKIVDYKSTPGKLRILGVHFGDKQARPNGSLFTIGLTAKSSVQYGMGSAAVSELTVANSIGTEQQLQGSTYTVQIGFGDKTQLNALIAEAQDVISLAIEGSQVGQYPAGSKAILQAAIDKAILSANDPTINQELIDQAIAELSVKLQAFHQSIVTRVVGDYTNDGKASVGDLALMVKAYGKTDQSTDWNDWKQFDLNNDKVIDIEDLSALARLIFNWDL